MSPRMKRIQIYIEPELDRELHRLAIRRRTSKAQLIREGAARIVKQELAPGEDPVLGIIGLGRSSPAKISENHDEYLIEEEMKSWK